MSIKHLSANTAHLISSSINITSVENVVKELVENAIDAGATSINVRLDKYGVDRIEVRDNGSGISKSDIPLACLASHTSKIINFSDMDCLVSYGFRGQALNALCAVADVSLTTRTEDDEFAINYTLDKEGRIISSKPSHFGVGTTILVENLFKRLPVRRKVLLTSANSLRTILRLLRCFSLAKPGLAVTLLHEGTNVWRKCSASKLLSAAQEVLGYKLAIKMEYLFWKGSQPPLEKVVEEDNTGILEVDDPECLEMEVEMLVPQRGSNIVEISSFPTGGYVPNVYLLINGRPVKYKKIDQLMNCWISRGTLGDLPNRKKPPWILKLNLPSNQLDVNLEADKTKILLRCEDMVLSRVEEILTEYYLIYGKEPDSNVPPLTNPELLKKRKKAPKESQQEAQPQSQDESCQPIAINTDISIVFDKKTVKDLDFSSSLPCPPAKQGRFELMEEIGMGSSNEISFSNTMLDVNTPSCLATNPSQVSNMEPLLEKEMSLINEFTNHENIIEIKIPLLPVGGFDSDVDGNKANQDVVEATGMERTGDKDVEFVEFFEGLDCDVSKSYFETERVRDGEKDIESVREEGKVCDLEVVVDKQDNVIDVESQLPSLDAWSRGSVNFGGVMIAEPVKVLQSTVTVNPSGLETKAVSTGLGSGNDHVTSPANNNETPAKSSSSSVSTPSSVNHLLKSPTDGNLAIGSPLPNACSQLGRRDMRGFASFASKERSKILAEKPGINFTEVASELAKQWERLSKAEQDMYVASAKASQSLKQQKAEANSSPSENHCKAMPKVEKNTNPKLRQPSLLNAFAKGEEKLPLPPPVGMVVKVTMGEIIKKISRRDRGGRKERNVMRDKISLVGQLRPSGMWVYCREEEVGILCHFALQESVVCKRLMENLSLPLRHLPVPIVLNESVLGPELWKKLISLEKHYDVFEQCTLISSDVIAKNGFCIKVIKDPTGSMSAVLTDVAGMLPSYGVSDLKEVLSLVNTPNCMLSECRPVQVANYIESEATRTCRQSPPAMAKSDVSALLKEWNGQPMCQHNKPIFVSLHSNTPDEREPEIKVVNLL